MSTWVRARAETPHVLHGTISLAAHNEWFQAVYELGVVDGVYFLSMELVEGATVAEMLRQGPLPQELTAQIGLQICEALQYAHEKFQVIHRDVTPRNIIVDGQDYRFVTADAFELDVARRRDVIGGDRVA